MSILKYFSKLPKESVEVAASESKLSTNETESVQATLTSLSAPTTDKKKRKYGDYDGFKR